MVYEIVLSALGESLVYTMRWHTLVRYTNVASIIISF